MNAQRIRAVMLKETREYRRNPLIIATMAITPLAILILPLLVLFNLPTTTSAETAKSAVGALSLLMLIVPVVIPPVIAASSVVGERDQGTLEPVLTSPVSAPELLLGKAIAAFIPAVGIAYAVYLTAAIALGLGAPPAIGDAVWRGPLMLAEFLFIPLLAGWTIWVGIGISTRASDIRVAQQLSTLAGFPLLAFTALISFQVIKPSLAIAIGSALALLAADLLAWRVVSALLDSERLLTGRATDGGAR
jgi:ABC-2 type transport system permease protein